MPFPQASKVLPLNFQYYFAKVSMTFDFLVVMFCVNILIQVESSFWRSAVTISAILWENAAKRTICVSMVTL